MRIKRKKDAGFTILEVLITLAILSIVVVSATKLLTANIKAVQEMEKSVEYTQNLRLATNQILNKIKRTSVAAAESVNVNAGPENSKQLYVADNLLLDTYKQTMNSNDAEFWVCLSEDNDYAELRMKDDETGSDKVVAEYVKEIDIEDRGQYVDITISVADTEDAVLSIPKTYAFSSVIPDGPHNGIWENIYIFSYNLNLAGGTRVNGTSSTVYIKDSDEYGNFTISNGARLNVSKVYIETDLQLVGGARIGTNQEPSSIYVSGDVDCNNGGGYDGTLWYTGEFSNYSNQCGDAINVPSIEFPPLSMPEPQSEEWYNANGFSDDSNPRDGMKYRGDSITIGHGKHISDISLYSINGNITIDNSARVENGILFAPNGKVSIQGGALFTGIIIAKEVDIANGTTVSYQNIDLDKLPF